MSCCSYWKAKYFKKTAEVALLCKYWDRQKDRHKHNIEQEIAKAKDLSTKAIAKAGARDSESPPVDISCSLVRAHHICGRQKQGS